MQAVIAVARSEGESLLGEHSDRFGTMVVDSIANAILSAPELSPQRSGTHSRSARSYTYEAALTFIAQRLDDPLLSVASIASHCRVSPRALHAAFSIHGESVSAYVREQRLQRCHDALRNPSMGDKNIIDIAMMWGFNDAAYFSNVYKARFGRTPKQEREAGTLAGRW